MRIDAPNCRIYVRQSWLNDMIICPERARLGKANPQLRVNTDATNLGTALHHGIETVLKGEVSDYDTMLEQVQGKHAELMQQPYRRTNVKEEHEQDYLRSMSQAFYEGILPNVEVGGKVEERFCVPLSTEGEWWVYGDYGIWLEGTMDYVSPSGVIWDWKTASRAYNAAEKQRSSIQASVYATACVRMGLCDDFPVDFRYGVMQRNLTPKHQIVNLVRNHSHYMWLGHMVRGAVKAGMDPQGPWLMNESSNLCSEAWCPFWSMCKGAFLTADDMAPVIVPAEGN